MAKNRMNSRDKSEVIATLQRGDLVEVVYPEDRGFVDLISTQRRQRLTQLFYFVGASPNQQDIYLAGRKSGGKLPAKRHAGYFAFSEIEQIRKI